MAYAIVWKAAAIVLGWALFVPRVAEAATFPAPLLGKTVTVKWTALREQRSLQISISTAGRAFSNETVAFAGTGGMSVSGSGAVREGAEQAPGDGPDSSGGGMVRFEGGALVVERQRIEGVRRVSITFDAGYNSCTVRVIGDREGGAGAVRGKGAANGQPLKVSIDMMTPSCSVVSGDALGERRPAQGPLCE
jgi:hypothetical protein